MRILICGDRNWKNYDMIDREVKKLAGMTMVDGPHVVIFGAARGADRMAGVAAIEHGLRIESYPADWGKYGKAAGHIRNQRMLTEGNPDEVWAFHNDLEHSKGTGDMVRRAKAAGIPVEIFTEQT